VVLVVGSLLVLQSALRLFFYYEAVYAGVQLLQPMPPAETMSIVSSLNLTLGVAGFVVVPGLFLMTRWGFWGTVVVCILTILFDGVSSVTVSLTAFAGLVLPVLFLMLLLPRRVRYLARGRGA